MSPNNGYNHGYGYPGYPNTSVPASTPIPARQSPLPGGDGATWNSGATSYNAVPQGLGQTPAHSSPSGNFFDKSLIRGLDLPLGSNAGELIGTEGAKAPNKLPRHHCFAWFSTLKSDTSQTNPIRHLNPSVGLAELYHYFKREYSDAEWISTVHFHLYQDSLPILFDL